MKAVSHPATFCNPIGGCLHLRRPRRLTERHFSVFKKNPPHLPSGGTFSHRLVNTPHHHKRFHQDFVGTDQITGGRVKIELDRKRSSANKRGALLSQSVGYHLIFPSLSFRSSSWTIDDKKKKNHTPLVFRKWRERNAEPKPNDIVVQE